MDVSGPLELNLFKSMLLDRRLLCHVQRLSEAG